MRLEIGGVPVGAREPLFVIAELGLNHGGSVEQALSLVDRAAEAGASAVKLQTFAADDLVAPGAPAPAHVPEASLREFFRRFELDRAAHMAIVERARARNLAVVSTPFSPAAVDMLVDVGVDALKIASGDLTYDGLIAHAARTGLPLILSTGLSTLGETAHAVALVRECGQGGLALLHCVSAYPVPSGSENLSAIQTLARAFDVPVGLSDHAPDTSAVPVIVALGASIYERHLMVPGTDGVDAAVSSTPEQLAAAIGEARRVSQALGHGRRECLPAEAVNLTASRRALHATRALKVGDRITASDIAVLRPGLGLSPSLETALVGTIVRRPIEAGAPFLGHDFPLSRSERGAA